MAKPKKLEFTDNADANKLLASHPLALLIGMLLDQQYPMEAAFASPLRLQERLGGSLDATAIAGMDPDALDAAFRERPALHRYPGNMAKRTQALCETIVEDYGGDAAAIWTGAADGADLYERLVALPGFGERKARIFVAVLGRRMEVQPSGWEEQAADWPSVADVATFADVESVRAAKQAMKKKSG